MTGAPGAIEVHLGQWLEAEPDARLAELFVAQARQPRVRIVQAIAHALHAAMFDVHDPRITEAKLGWWIDELSQAPRHPLTEGLAAAGAQPAEFVALRDAAGTLLRLSMRASFESLAQWLDPLEIAAAALSRATRLVGIDDPAAPPRALAASRLLRAIRDWPSFSRPERAWLPLDLLARHRIDRIGAVAHAALAADLAHALSEPLACATALRGVDGARIAAARVWAARMVANPGCWLDGSLRAPRWNLVVSQWRVGRRG